MESEKVKEIKKALKCCIKLNNTKYTDRERQLACINCPYANKDECDVIISKNCLTLNTELESENAELKKYKLDWLNGEKMHLQAEMEETEFELASSNRLFEMVSKENKQLKDRIAELEFELSKKKLEINALKCGKEIAEGVIEVVKMEETKLALKQFAERLREKAYPLYSEIGVDYAIPFYKIDETLKEMINEKKNP